MNKCTKCIHHPVCKTAESCDGYVSGCKHFKEEKHGRWIDGGKTMVDDVKGCVLHCSECNDYCYNFEPNPRPNYCSNCGADMKGE